MKHVLASVLFGFLLFVVVTANSNVSDDQPIAHYSVARIAGSDLFSDSGAMQHPDSDPVVKVAFPQRLSGSEFQHQQQRTPTYALVVEFLPADLSAKHFVYIRNIPDTQPWFEISGYVPNRYLLAGWKVTRHLLPNSYLYHFIV